jgi:4-amino-4-deoxy-L-arabinose transferase-like glycosyltransferase
MALNYGGTCFTFGKPIVNFAPMLHQKILSPPLIQRSFWALVILRAFFNAVIPLMDQTEARYGNIARIMAETGEWIVLQVDYGVPFWAKPPLSSWASAASLWLFGVNEFFVRLPYLLVCVGLALWIKRYADKDDPNPYLLPLILLTIPEFFLHAGVVSTDVFLTLSITLVMLSFWEALQTGAKKYWGYLFFAGMGLGLLAKGPIVVLLTLPPLGLWCLWTKNLTKAFRTAPWLGGIPLLLLISLPWYFWAEKRAPGFIDYFIVGEHFNRFFNAEWKGDLYGFPKQQPLGIIWLFLVGFSLPWFGVLFRFVKNQYKTLLKNDWVAFLLFWLLWTPLFFTTSKSLIHPYILPVIPPLALLVYQGRNEVKRLQPYLYIALGIPLVLLIVYSSGLMDNVLKDNTDKYLVEQTPDKLYTLDAPKYSTAFYTQGKIEQITQQTLDSILGQTVSFGVLLNHKTWQNLPLELQAQLKKVDQNKKRGLYRPIAK